MKRILLIVVAIISTVGAVKAQDGNNTSYFLSNLPQRYRSNPAYQPEYNAFVGLPGLSGISINYLNSSFTAEDLLRKRGDSVYMDVNRFYKSLHKRNYISFNNENSILSIGFKAKSWYATLDVVQKNDFLFRYNKDIFTFLKYGNADHPNMDFGKLGVNGNSYLEVALGLSKKVNSKLTVGGRLKYLAGVANISTTDSDLSLTTERDGSLLLHSRQNIRVSAPVRIQNKQTGLPFAPNQLIDWDDFDMNTDDLAISDILNTKNPGFAIDLGGEYKFNDKINLFASVTDLGFIRWGNKEFAYNFSQDASFKWDGADFSNSLNKDDENYRSMDDAFEDLTDSLKDNFRLSSKGNAYTTMLSPKIFIGGTYQLNRMFDVGALFRASVMNRMFIPSFTASVNGRLIRNVSASVSYSIIRGSYVNVGAGVTAKLGPLQLYVQTDNLLAANYTNTQSANARFGVNLLFGHKDFKKKKKMEEESLLEIVAQPVIKDTVKVDKTPVLADPVAPLKEENVALLEETAILQQFYVIMGSFKDQKKAEQLNKKLNESGFSESVVLINDAGMFRVSAKSFTSHTACWEEVFRIRKELPKYKDVWGLTVKG